MRAAYRQFDAGPVVNLARHPRGTDIGSSTGKWPKWAVDRWGADGTYTYLTGITDHPDGITTAVRLTTTTTTRNSHGFHLAGNPEQAPPGIATSQMVPVQPGERLTLSCWLRYTGAVAQGYRIKFRTSDATGSTWVTNSSLDSPTVSLPSGTWKRLALTYTVPEGSGFLALFVTNVNGVVDAIGDTVDGTGLMVTRTAAPLANLAADPAATALTIPARRFGWVPQWFGSGATGTTTKITGASDGPPGFSTYLRKTWTAMGANLSDVAFTHVPAVANQPIATQGESYSISSYFRASKGWTVTLACRIVVEWYDGAGVKIGATVNGSNIATVTAGTWHNLSMSNVIAPAGTFSIRAFQLVFVENGTWTVGDTIDGTGLMVTRTPPLWQYADGNSPGWRWLGVVNTSESAGYPKP